MGGELENGDYQVACLETERAQAGSPLAVLIEDAFGCFTSWPASLCFASLEEAFSPIYLR